MFDILRLIQIYCPKELDFLEWLTLSPLLTFTWILFLGNFIQVFTFAMITKIGRRFLENKNVSGKDKEKE